MYGETSNVSISNGNTGQVWKKYNILGDFFNEKKKRFCILEK